MRVQFAKQIFNLGILYLIWMLGVEKLQFFMKRMKLTLANLSSTLLSNYYLNLGNVSFRQF